MNDPAVFAGLGLSLSGSGRELVRRAGSLTRSGRLGSPSGRGPGGLPPWTAGTALAVAVASIASTVGAPLGAAAGIAGTAVLVLVRDVRTRRVDDRRRSALQSAVRLAAAQLDAGAQPDTALGAAADVCPEHAMALRNAARAMRQGETPQFEHRELAPIGYACGVAVRTGAPLAAVLGHVADDLEHAEERRRRVTALTAGPRASAVVLALLPLLGLLLGSSLGAEPVHVLVSSRAGQVLALAGVALDALGVWWTRRIVRAAQG